MYANKCMFWASITKVNKIINKWCSNLQTNLRYHLSDLHTHSNISTVYN